MSFSALSALLTRIRVREYGFGVSRCGLQSAEACPALGVMTSFVNRPVASGIVSMKRELEISRYQQVGWCKEFVSWRAIRELVRGSEPESIAVCHDENRRWQQGAALRHAV